MNIFNISLGMYHMLKEPFSFDLPLHTDIDNLCEKAKKKELAKKKREKHPGRIASVPIHSVFIFSLNTPHHHRLKVN